MKGGIIRGGYETVAGNQRESDKIREVKCLKISTIELVESKDGLIPFNIPSLGDIVILSGSNGSGKLVF